MGCMRINGFLPCTSVRYKNGWHFGGVFGTLRVAKSGDEARFHIAIIVDDLPGLAEPDAIRITINANVEGKPVLVTSEVRREEDYGGTVLYLLRGRVRIARSGGVWFTAKIEDVYEGKHVRHPPAFAEALLLAHIGTPKSNR